MKIYYILPLLLLLFSSTIIAQDKTDINIPINTKFTLRLTPESNGKYSYVIEKSESFKATLDLNSVSSLFDEKISPDKIVGIVAYSSFAGSKNATLVIKSGLEKSLNYSVMIKDEKKKDPEKTSVSNLFTNTISTEIWPININYIIINDFKDM